MYVPEEVLDVCPNRLVCWWVQLSQAQRQRIVEEQPAVADEVSSVLAASQVRNLRGSTDSRVVPGLVLSPQVSNGSM
jgi:hypothetical protein